MSERVGGWGLGVGLALSCVVASGCTTAERPVGTPVETATEQPLESGYEMLERLPASTGVLASTIYPLTVADRRYARVDGGEPVVRRRRPTEEYHAQWSEDEVNARTHFWRLDDSGDLVTTAVIDHEDQALSIFDPPLVAAYAVMAPGERREATSAMRVLDVRNPRRQKEAGTATITIHYVEDQVLRTSLGRLTAQRIDTEFVADLRLADATTRRTLYVVPDLGIVLEHRYEQIVLLGILPSTEDATYVLETDLEGLETEGPR